MNNLFGDNILFLYIFACITIMNYSRMSETQKMILFYLLTFGLAILKVISVKESILFLSLIAFMYLEFLTEDSEKIKFITRIRYKIIDFSFLMVFQYSFFSLFISLVFASTTVQHLINSGIMGIVGRDIFLSQILSISFFFITIYIMSEEKFKIKKIKDLIDKVFIPPINESTLSPNQQYFDILARMEDKTYFTRKSGFNALSTELVCSKIKNFRRSLKDEGIENTKKKYWNAPQIIRGYSTLEMQLIRSVALESGYNLTIIRKIFEILYTNIIFKSMQEYYDKNNYVNNHQFKEYLLSIYIQNVRTKINGNIYSSMAMYLNEDSDNWTKEKFFIACLGLPYQTFTEGYVLYVHKDIIEDYSLNVDIIKQEITKIGKEVRDYYGSENQKDETILIF